jgi:uncharacterized protein Yka (UPF0111/DUF47 family)
MPKKLKLQELFYKAAEMVERGQKEMNQAITALCEHNQAEMKKYVEKTIATEHALDEIHDQVVERMFSKESLVFSRADRLLLINEMDDVIDMAEMVVRRISVFLPDVIPPTLATKFVAIAEKAEIIGSLLKDAILAIFNDFDKAFTLAHKVQDVRRDAKEDYMQLLEEIYRLNPEPRDLLYFDRTIRNIMRNIDKAEQFADDLRMLIFKYRV